MTQDPFDRKTSNPDYCRLIHRKSYARYRDDLGRRETWKETCQRLEDFWLERIPLLLPIQEGDKQKILETAIRSVVEQTYELEVMPSMRTIMTAGPALTRDEVAGYNCWYLPLNHPWVFDEIMYLLMCGGGVGFSVERQYIKDMPVVAEEMHPTETTVVFHDSRIGWSTGLRDLLSLLWSGKIPKLDFEKIRPAGARLMTFGGRSSGPGPLKELCLYAIDVFKEATGRRLNSLECHDLCCKIGDVIVSGGVRRSALISLSNPSDDRMRYAKSGEWWRTHPHRALANNSVVFTERPKYEVFLHEMMALYQSKSGERGIFSRPACNKQVPDRREKGYDWGCNPCSEIILRPYQPCNLSEVVVRSTDDAEDLKRKVRTAAFMGTLQSTLIDFRYLRKIYRENAEEERLLGVSLTGILDHPTLAYDEALMRILRDEVVAENEKWADFLNINRSAATTCVKPSGTVSQLVDSASGCHPRYSRYYIRTLRSGITDPLTKFLKDEGFPCEPDRANQYNLIFSFPVKAPEGAVVTDDLHPVEQLEIWKRLNLSWCEHKPSFTVQYTNDSFLQVAQWVWTNFDVVTGISMLPSMDHSYAQAPYQPISEAEYHKAVEKMPKDVDWTRLEKYESEEESIERHELACGGLDSCEIDGIV